MFNLFVQAGDPGVSALFSALKVNSSLISLSVGGNLNKSPFHPISFLLHHSIRAGESGLKTFVEMLKVNSTLTYFNGFC